MSYPTMLLEEQMQSERLARAQTALERGDMTVLSINECTWMVTSKGRQYAITLDGDAWACTCADFAGRCKRFGLVCKHIEAVRHTETLRIADAKPNEIPHTEEVMNQSLPMVQDMAITQGGLAAPPANELIWRLRQPLDMSRVKRRQAPGQGTVPYLEGHDVIEVANDLFQFRWSFDLLSEPTVMRWDKVVTFYDQRARKKVPLLGEDGKPTIDVAGIVYLTGKITVELGGKTYSHADVGRCVFSGDTPEALDMAIAGAATDCLKRCFRQCGDQFGLTLYDKEVARTAGLENSTSTEVSSNHNGSQESAHPMPLNASPTPLPAAAAQPEALQYRDGTAVEMNNTAEVNAFNTFKAANQGLAPGSRDVLRAWSARTIGKK